MSSVQLWGEQIPVVAGGYDATLAQEALDRVVTALAFATRRAAALERTARHQDTLARWFGQQADALQAIPVRSPDDPALRAIALDAHQEIDALLGQLRAAGVPERALAGLGAQALARLRTAVFTVQPLDLTFSFPADAIPGSAAQPPSPPGPDSDQPPLATDPSPTAPVATPPSARSAAGEAPGPVRITLTPIDTVEALRQAQDILAQFADSLVVREVLPEPDGATFVTEIFRPVSLVQRFARIPGVAHAEEEGPHSVSVTLDPLPAMRNPGTTASFSGRLGGLRASPHGPGIPGR